MIWGVLGVILGVFLAILAILGVSSSDHAPCPALGRGQPRLILRCLTCGRWRRFLCPPKPRPPKPRPPEPHPPDQDTPTGQWGRGQEQTWQRLWAWPNNDLTPRPRTCALIGRRLTGTSQSAVQK